MLYVFFVTYTLISVSWDFHPLVVSPLWYICFFERKKSFPLICVDVSVFSCLLNRAARPAGLFLEEAKTYPIEAGRS